MSEPLTYQSFLEDQLQRMGKAGVRYFRRAISCFLAGDFGAREAFNRGLVELDRQRTAFHEASHAVLQYLLLKSFPAIAIFSGGGGISGSDLSNIAEAKENHRGFSDFEKVEAFRAALISCGFPDPLGRLEVATIFLLQKHWDVIEQLAKAALDAPESEGFFLNDQQVFAIISACL
jgi:hypothetical protein